MNSELPYRQMLASVDTVIVWVFALIAIGEVARRVWRRRHRPSFYIASSLANAEFVSRIGVSLIELGYRWTYDWTVHSSALSEGDARWAEVAKAELNGVRSADFVLVMLPGGWGTHVEIGAALALGKPVYLVAQNEADLIAPSGHGCVFHGHPLVRRFVGLDAVVVLMAMLTERRRR